MSEPTNTRAGECLACGRVVLARTLTDGYCGMGCGIAYEAGIARAMREAAAEADERAKTYAGAAERHCNARNERGEMLSGMADGVLSSMAAWCDSRAGR